MTQSTKGGAAVERRSFLKNAVIAGGVMASLRLTRTFGAPTVNAGRLDYCKYIAKKCNLKGDDFFIPKRALNKT